MTTRFELVDEGFADPCLTTWPRHHIWSEYFHSIWSGRRGSNSLPPPWQGGALPDELRPHIGAFTLAPQGKTTRIGLEPTTPSVTGWCSNQLSYRAISGAVITTPLWSGRRGSNSLPPPWQGGALPDELRPRNNGYFNKPCRNCQALFHFFLLPSAAHLPPAVKAASGAPVGGGLCPLPPVWTEAGTEPVAFRRRME